MYNFISIYKHSIHFSYIKIVKLTILFLCIVIIASHAHVKKHDFKYMMLQNYFKHFNEIIYLQIKGFFLHHASLYASY